MLLNVAPRTARGSRLTMGTRGSTDESELGGPTVISYDPEAADTETVDLLNDPPYQDAGTGGPGTMALTLALDELSKEYETLRDSYSGQSAETTEVFNWYKGSQKSIFHDTTARVEIETSSGVSTATLTVKYPSWGTAKTKGNLAKGHVIQMASDSAMYRIDGFAPGFNYDAPATFKLLVTPLSGAATTQAAAAYRIVLPRIVHENWVGRVIMAGGSSADASSTVIQGNVTIAPENQLPQPVPIPYE